MKRSANKENGGPSLVIVNGVDFSSPFESKLQLVRPNTSEPEKMIHILLQLFIMISDDDILAYSINS